MKNTKMLSKIHILAKKIAQIKEQQRRQGFFCHDRELLSCSRCRLEEDVTGEGYLIVAKSANPGVDTRLRFSAVDEEKGLYRCPGCGKEVRIPDSALS
jgi:hypothetical protein